MRCLDRLEALSNVGVSRFGVGIPTLANSDQFAIYNLQFSIFNSLSSPSRPLF
jgi:hypothetical protein